ncbi:hypothetical protein [Ekhidna sp.]|uniref:hypothetical protein n=1 Tax=Ekhidna sp. TaxID=2608089 RepID=UPI003BAD1884
MHVFTNISRHRLLVVGIIFLLLGFTTYLLRDLKFDFIYLSTDNLPSFTHTAAFSLITYSFARHLHVGPFVCCLFWVVTNCVLELMQRDLILEGVFDLLDIIYIVFGGILSYLIIKSLA